MKNKHSGTVVRRRAKVERSKRLMEQHEQHDAFDLKKFVKGAELTERQRLLREASARRADATYRLIMTNPPTSHILSD